MGCHSFIGACTSVLKPPEYKNQGSELIDHNALNALAELLSSVYLTLLNTWCVVVSIFCLSKGSCVEILIPIGNVIKCAHLC